MQQQKIVLSGRKIPRDAQGDPAFAYLRNDSATAFDSKEKGPGVFDTFTSDEVCLIVNRYIKFQEASALTHKKLAQRTRDKWAPIKQQVHKMFNVSFAKATDGQITQAIEQLAKEREAKQ